VKVRILDLVLEWSLKNCRLHVMDIMSYRSSTLCKDLGTTFQITRHICYTFVRYQRIINSLEVVFHNTRSCIMIKFTELHTLSDITYFQGLYKRIVPG